MTDDPLYAEDNAERLARLGPHASQFTDPEKARAAGRKSAQLRRQRQAQHEATTALEQQREEAVAAIVEQYADLDLAVMTAACLAKILESLLNDEVPIRNGAEAARLLEVLGNAWRLERSLPTHVTAHISGNVADLQARLRRRVDAEPDVIELPGPNGNGAS
ncbi:MAG: hypothetical protein WD598_17040 [Acidimicrobiia bacterium]